MTGAAELPQGPPMDLAVWSRWLNERELAEIRRSRSSRRPKPLSELLNELLR